MTRLEEMTQQLDQVCDAAARDIREAAASGALEETRVRVFGKKGSLSVLMRGMGAMEETARRAFGEKANARKAALLAALEERARELQRKDLEQSAAGEKIDVSLPGPPPLLGTLHPITLVQRELERIFGSMGFTVETGPDVENDYYNYEALNFAPDHPARDMHDTFYLASDLLLRTHTSPVQIHTMKTRKPPLAVIAPGRCYRCDADTTHSPMFFQVEGFMVDTNIRFSDLKGVLEAFIHEMFGPDVPFRMRPSFFPFTEPSAEVDIFFERRHPDGHVVREWMEILGAGMIHPNVLTNCDIDPERYGGFAFGMGIERIAMLKYGINTIYTFFENDLRFLKQFR